MGKWLQKLRRNCKGAVTVFVTLMLIPAVLVSGSGVDIARLYTARSEVRDANQLAANSALASYDALLQDLYGLFGIMKSDSELADMMDEYIRLTLFGEDWNQRGMGTYALFQGSAVTLGSVAAAPNQNLSNPEVLRRQIEEYVKFRAPAVIVNEVLDKLDTFDKIKEDASVIKDKMEIEDKIEDIDKIYEKLYKCIQEVNKAPQLERSAYESVNDYIGRIERTIDDLYTTRNDQYTEAALDEDDDLAGDYENKYKGLFDNLHDLVVGGKVREIYDLGHENILGGYSNGSFRSSYSTKGLKGSIGDSKKNLSDIISNSSFANDSLKELVSLAEDADKKKKELAQMVDDLEAKLNEGKCSSELKDGLTKTKNSNNQTQIEFYRSMLSYNITNMATSMRDYDTPKLEAMISELDGVVYGNINMGVQGCFSLDTLKDLDEGDLGYGVDLIMENRQRDINGMELLEDKLAYLDQIQPTRYSAANEYKLFQDMTSESKAFYDLLKSMYSNDNNTTKKKNVQKGLEKVAGQIQDQFTGILEFDPLGAYRYSRGGSGGGTGSGTDFGSSGDWGGSGQLKKVTKNALNDNLLTRLSNAGNAAANKLLLLTYSSEMFSCYATNAGYSDPSKESSEPTEENMAGIPLGIKVNYYFQSELEYLYNGNFSDAKDNLKSVTAMILLIRFVLNYTISFTISVVNDTVLKVEEALSFLGPGAIVIGEMVRLVMALGESVTDVSRLKNGCKVVLFKRNGSASGKTIWRFSLEGVLSQIADGVVGDVSSSAFGTTDRDDDPDGFVYKDYMRLFLLLVDGDVLAQRTANLIALNVTNYRDKIGNNSTREARQQAMSNAELFEMNKAVTGFSVTTTVNLKMLFLSSPIAQRGIAGGVVPPTMKEVAVTDYRGY